MVRHGRRVSFLMGTVPLQSGYWEHDQNGPDFPFRLNIEALQMGQAGPASTGTDKVSAPQCSTNCAIQFACLATNASRDRRLASISSSACSQIAVIPGSAIAAGTASIRVWAAAEAINARFFFSK